VIGLTVQGQRLYWANASGDVLSVPAGGGQPASLLGEGPPNGVRITSDAKNIYIVDSPSTSVIGLAIQGGAATTVVSGNTEVNDVISDGTNLYWTEPSAGIVMRAPITGGGATVVASNQKTPTFLAADGIFLYWANEGVELQNDPGNTTINRIQRQ
jgi:hypothetical protein